MKQIKYIGHTSQIYGVEEYRCLNGKKAIRNACPSY